MKIKINRLMNLNAAICQAAEIKKAKVAGMWKFGFLILDIKLAIRDILEESRDKIQVLQEELSALKIKYCKKDAEGLPVIIESKIPDGIDVSRYAGLIPGQCPEYDKENREVEKRLKELLNTEIEIGTENIAKIEEGEIHPEVSQFVFEQLVEHGFIKR